MPKQVISYQIAASGDAANPTGYITDIGSELSYRGTFNLPPDVDLASAATIVNAVSGTISDEQVPCSDGNASGRFRKLVFIRASGNTMSIVVPNRADIITVATNIRTALNDGNPDNKVICVKLLGEIFRNLNDELGVNYTGTVAKSHRAVAGSFKQNYLSGVINYTSDFGNTAVQSVRSITEKAVEEPAAQLGGVWDTCTGGLLDLLNCGNGRRNPRKHRRFNLTFATKFDVAADAESAQSEVIELPCANGTSADILACGQATAALPGLYCIGYQGESYDRVHKLMPAA